MNNKNVKAFKEYANGFDLSNHHLNSKYHHSLRVATIAEEIGSSIFNNKEIVELCYSIGLLHDVGRFPQYTKYGSFNDFETVDHADYSVEMLFGDSSLIKVFDIPSKYHMYLNNAIKYHNKLKIDVTELRACVKENNLDYILASTLCKIARDADKLDLFELWIKKTEVDVSKYEKEGYTEEFLECFKAKKSCNFKNTKTILDRVIGILAFPYDLNFDSSKTIFKHLAKDYADSILRNYGVHLNDKDRKILEECANTIKKDFGVK